ncbi:hypothetical protein C8K36_10342 [Rhodococcus sp. OK519]|uniref:M56 family metallopeptidase n=1 Tax=Rhodococcus sp. OK519 TaxID=2135729 RepID=UPI000D39EAED|nr:hypothetical protein C8K36_10342 [Rhodococcus sp. OK519]
MIVALGLLAAVGVLGFAAPRWLDRLAAPHRHPRVSLAAWLSSQVMFVASIAAIPLVLWLRPGDRWHLLPATTVACIRSLREAGTVPWILAIETATWGVGVLLFGWLVGTVSGGLLRHRRDSDERASMLRLVGDNVAGDGANVVRVHGGEFEAYSIGGRVPTIVLGAGAAGLDPDVRAAVLAHERAHLRGRHHLLVAWADALRAALPAVPLAREGAAWVRVLVELSADRHAAASCGCGALSAALLAGSGNGRGAASADTGFAEDRIAWLSGLRATRRGAAVLHYPFAFVLSALPVFATLSVVVTAIAYYCAMLGG